MSPEQPPSSLVSLGNFLRTRREQIRPEDVGLPSSNRRRTPGLRREEVAVLANVGVSWLTWLEQGRATGVSAEILDSVAGALRLSSEDRTYVHRLASGRRATQGADAVVDSESDGGQAVLLQRLVDAMANPSYIADPFWTVVAMNSAAASTFDTRVGTSCLQRFFTDQKLARSHVHREMMARSLVAQFRSQSARFPDDPRFEAMARRLCQASEAFRELWQRQVVGDSYHVDVVYDHPELGRLSFDPVVLSVPKYPTLRVFTYLPKSGTRTQEVLLSLPRKPAGRLMSSGEPFTAFSAEDVTRPRFRTSIISERRTPSRVDRAGHPV